MRGMRDREWRRIRTSCWPSICTSRSKMRRRMEFGKSDTGIDQFYSIVGFLCKSGELDLFIFFQRPKISCHSRDYEIYSFHPTFRIACDLSSLLRASRRSCIYATPHTPHTCRIRRIPFAGQSIPRCCPRRFLLVPGVGFAPSV